MKCLKRNKQVFYFANFKDIEPIIDEYGNETGEYRVVRGKPEECWGNISYAKGSSEAQMFGTNVDYDKVIVIDKPYPEFTEDTVLWVDISPSGDRPHDYLVKRIARSLNSLSLAISRVNVS